MERPTVTNVRPTVTHVRPTVCVATINYIYTFGQPIADHDATVISQSTEGRPRMMRPKI